MVEGLPGMCEVLDTRTKKKRKEKNIKKDILREAEIGRISYSARALRRRL